MQVEGEVTCVPQFQCIRKKMSVSIVTHYHNLGTFYRATFYNAVKRGTERVEFNLLVTPCDTK
jgi:hypothetical protein